MYLPHAFKHATLILSLLALSACSGGGGGGGGSTSTSVSGFTLSGNITLPDTAAVDSDTNDPDQANWASNDTFGSAQQINTPIQLIGNLNTAVTGPSGKTYVSGDELDIFQTNLSSGQVIELFFAANTSGTDIDLALIKADGSTVAGYSISSSGNRECIRITTSGNYYVIPYVYTGNAPPLPLHGGCTLFHADWLARRKHDLCEQLHQHGNVRSRPARRQTQNHKIGRIRCACQPCRYAPNPTWR